MPLARRFYSGQERFYAYIMIERANKSPEPTPMNRERAAVGAGRSRRRYGVVQLFSLGGVKYGV